MKMNRQIILASTMALTLAVLSCKEEKKNDAEAATAPQDSTEMAAPEITLEKLQGSPAFEDAALSLNTPETMKVAKAGETDFAFKVTNYELGAQTESPNAKMLANSDKGQHIHFIMDNQPYSAHYEPEFKEEVPAGVHHLVAFLSRSYHESVKNKNSVVVRKLMVGDNPQDSLGLDMKAPTLIYSRPKGEYSGADTENLLLDFFVLNTTLSEDGNKVRATVNGNEFMITEWAPQVLRGLPKGEVTVKLELLDAEGNLIPGPFNEVTRTVTLKE